MINKKQYVKPKALNISGLGVLGYEPLGICATGHDPTTSNCANGETPEQPHSCNPTGFTPLVGGCQAGGNVANVCGIGSLHTG